MSEPQAAVVAAQLTRLEAIAAQRARLGNLLTEKISGLPGVMPHQVHPEDRCVYWFYFFRIKPEAFRCDRASSSRPWRPKARPARPATSRCRCIASRCSSSTASSPAAGPSREFGLTTMDYTKHQTPEAEAILRTGIRVTIHEGMTEQYIAGVAEAIRKVARHYAA